MEMCYDGALFMPKNYAVMDREEMCYVGGGDTTKNVSFNKLAAWVAIGAGLTAFATGVIGYVAAYFAIEAASVNMLGAALTMLGGVLSAMGGGFALFEGGLTLTMSTTTRSYKKSGKTYWTTETACIKKITRYK